MKKIKLRFAEISNVQCALRWQQASCESSLNKTIDLTKNMSAMSIPKTPDKNKAIKSNASASTPAKK